VPMTRMHKVIAPDLKSGSGVPHLCGCSDVVQAARANDADIWQGGTMRWGKGAPNVKLSTLKSCCSGNTRSIIGLSTRNTARTGCG
jgi:hypothetical protein